MSDKGKKFDAHKKHFDKKEKVLTDELKHMQAKYKKLMHEHRLLINSEMMLRTQLTSKEQWIERLLELTELTKEELEQSLKADKATTDFMGILEIFGAGKKGLF